MPFSSSTSSISPPYPPTLTRALTYPYSRPSTSYLFSVTSPHVRSLPSLYTPSSTSHHVLAIGSNASPDQLLRKFHHQTTTQIPVLRVKLYGLDIVYARIIANYGSIPATILQSPNTICESYITVLTPELLKEMHTTEGGYRFCRLKQTQDTFVTLENDDKIEFDIFCYVAREGALHIEEKGGIVALKEIHANERVWQSLWQEQVLDWVWKQSSIELSFCEFVRIAGKEKREDVKKVFGDLKEVEVETCWEVIAENEHGMLSIL